MYRTRITFLVAIALLALPLLAGPAHAQTAFISSAITISSDTLFLVNTEDNSLVARAQLSTEASGYISSAFGPTGETIYLAPTTRRRIEAVSTTLPYERVSYPLSGTPRWLDITPDGGKAYVSTAEGFEVIDLATGDSQLIFGVGVIRTVEGVAVSPSGDLVYTVVSGNATFPGGLAVVDTATDTLIDQIPFDISSSVPQGVTVNQDGTRVYVANLATPGSLLVVDPAIGEIVDEVEFPETGAPRVTTLSSDGQRLYVATEEGVAIVDTASNAVLLETIVGLIPGALDLHPDGERVYMLDLNGDLYELDATTLDVLDSVNTPAANLLQSNEFFAPIP